MVQVNEQVVVDGFALQPGIVLPQRRVFLALSQQVGAEFQQGFRGSGDLPQLVPGKVGPMLADAGQHLRRNPPAELLCFWKFAGQHQGIQAGFVDDGELLHPARGENFAHPFVLCINVVANRLLRVFVPQRQRHVLSNQPRFAVNLHGADRPKLRVFENFHLVHIVPPSAVQQKGGRYQPPAYISWLT